MHLHFERNTNTKCDCTILSLSWMGKVPDDIPEDDGWKLNRTNYYQEGWLATGNVRGIVGVTFTTSHCRKNVEYPLRTNYNLRGHRSDVILVKWNEPYQKLASCDSSGIIFVWIKYEGRWSIELINDRNTPVTHFSWSHDGRMALICYQDGFVLVGSVAGQRYWSSMLNLESTITCGIWTPDDQQVYFGTTQGQVIVMDVHGAMVSQVQLCNDVGITSMSWSCEKFKMEEGEESEPGVTNAAKRSFVLAVSFQNGFIYLLKSFDDVSPSHINTGLDGALGMVMEWSNSRELLAVAGTSQKATSLAENANSPGVVYNNLLKFYTETGALLYQAHIPNSNAPVSALTWGHNDKRLFIATGTQVHIAWVSRRVASLQLLCRLQIQASIGSETLLPLLPLPSRIKTLIGNLFAQTIRCCVPDLKSLREFVSRPPLCSTRLHCTMIRHDDDSNISSGTCYTLYLEYLGGLVPLLKGKRTSKIRPEFVIFDPQVNETSHFFQHSPGSKSSSSSSQSTSTTANGRTDSSDSEYDERLRGSPHTPRKRRIRQQKRHGNGHDRNTLTTTSNDGSDALDELAYVDTLPEEVKLVEVTSNIWGTKFKMHGLAKTVPANLGQVTYKTSLLHLQPRQMTLVITELRDDFPLGPDPSFNPNLFSEDEDENHAQSSAAVAEVALPNDSGGGGGGGGLANRKLNELAPPIAPMSPRPNRLLARHRNSSSSSTSNGGNQIAGALGRSPLARAESYDDDSTSESPEAAAPGPSTSAAASSSSSSSHKVLRPKNITSTFGRPNGSSCGQSRHAISPLFSDGSVPTLQSPKNAVAPTDIIFERPAVSANGQTTLMSYSSNADYTNNVVQVKNALLTESLRSTNSHVNPVPLNLSLNLERMDAAAKVKAMASQPSTSKKREMQFIDDEMQASSSAAAAAIAQNTVNAVVAPVPPPSDVTNPMKRTPTVVSIAPVSTDVITRSCSVGYLDSVAITPSDEALTALRREAPHKRLILVDNRKCRKKRMHQGDSSKPRLVMTGKSKSLDSCDLLSTQAKLNSKQLEKLHEETLAAVGASSKKKSTCSSCTATSGSAVEDCKHSLPSGSISKSAIIPKDEDDDDDIIRADLDIPACREPSKDQEIKCHKPAAENMPRRRIDVITSFTDSPLFTRKHRFGNRNNGDTSSPTLGRKNENGFSLVKQLTEGRWRRKDAKQATPANSLDGKPLSGAGDGAQQQRSTENRNSDTIEATPVESRASVSLHTQALTTLENIISRLRDLDEHLTPPATPHRLPRSSPASPAASKKNKRYQSSSPIRTILNSPLLNRRQRKKQNIIDSSDDEANGGNGSGEENTNANGCSKQYRDLETFQKAQLRQKLKRGRIEPNGSSTCNNPAPVRREFVMHNKAPMWNEMSQVYQLDFGGRVTQESAKNFQIEFRGKQVMQFGRIDGNAYTLDFQYPFSALQAFAVALANVTQRLK
ncbi:tubby-related protein 4 isoform X2 [Musca domestica]|uniref:Tubby-related protein 4 isoform X2 n=1 Tax=Musca domestica TaxID=7370 RepID=A0ABM3UKV6_MUSDO|nr:tubby-related protein 4 isoform X2 [Musca domestica]